MTSRTRSFVILSLLVMVVGVGTGLTAYYVGLPVRLSSDRGSAELLRYVPSDVAVVAYADVREVMASALRRRINRALPGQETGQREFQDRTGIDIETDIDHVVACMGRPAGSDSQMPGSGMVLARGLFDEPERPRRAHGRADFPRPRRRTTRLGKPFLPAEPTALGRRVGHVHRQAPRAPAVRVARDARTVAVDRVCRVQPGTAGVALLAEQDVPQ